jgi:phage antirepressor YoqD-like protein
MNQMIRVFNYEGTDVTFREKDGDLYVNATEMAAKFSKSPTHWLRNSQAKIYVKEYSTLRNRNPEDLIKIVNGGASAGTWMHEDLAIEFSRWLNPKFSIWCNDRIKELLTTGKVEISQLTPLELAKMLVKAEEEKLLLVEKVSVLQPKADYNDQVLQSGSLLATTEIAALLNMSAVTFNRRLKEAGIQRRVNGRWVLMAKYMGNDYTKDKTVPYKTDDDGTVHSNTSMYWTEKGKEFLLRHFMYVSPKHI